MSWRETIRTILRKRGYTLHGAIRGCTYAKDSFDDQKTLLGTQTARTIFDVGANDGGSAKKYRRLFPEATIYSFEPFADSYDALVKSSERDRLVKPVQCAVSNVSGTAVFQVHADSETNSLLKAVNTEMARKVGSVEVPTITVDEFCAGHGVEQLDILKLDVQGGELLALTGANKMLSGQTISLIFSEVSFAALYEDQAHFAAISTYLAACGYTLFDLYDFRYTATGQLAWGDAIFMNQRIASAIHSNHFSGA